MNEKAFNIDDWKVIGEYVYSSDGGCHQAFYSPKKDVTCVGVDFEEGERVQVEQSLKYSAKESRLLWELSGLREIRKWSTPEESYSKCRFGITRNTPQSCVSRSCTSI